MWKYIDQAACITVENSKRIDDFIENNKTIGLQVDIRAFPKLPRRASTVKESSLWSIMTYDNSCCEEVCVDTTRSHLQLVEDAYNQGKRNVLIFEDDARWELPLDIQKIKRVLEWLEKNDDKYDIFFFGYVCHPNPIGIPVSRDIARIYNPLLAHAYLVNRSAMKTIIHNKEMILNAHTAIDKYYSRHTPYLKKYGIYPSLNYQCEDPLYYKKGMEKVGLGWISMKTWCRASNFISYYFLFLIFLVFLVLLILLLLISKK